MSAKRKRDTPTAAEERAVVRDEERQRAEYGGFHVGAAFFGWLVATGLGALLVAFLTAAGSALALTAIDTAQEVTQYADDASAIGIAGGLLLLAAMGTAYYAGGYVAGRLSRFDGARQGLGVWIMGVAAVIVLAMAGAAFGAQYNLLQQVNLPRIPIDQGNLTAGGLVALLLTVAVTLAAAIWGGKMGEAYHRKVDRAGL